jgi:hypothetical protein
MLGRRLIDQTGAGVGFDSTKQLVIRIRATKTITGGSLGTSSPTDNYFSYNGGDGTSIAEGDIEVLQDPFDLLEYGSTAQTGIFLKRYADNWDGSGSFPYYTIKLSTMSGAITSNGNYFDFNIDARGWITIGPSPATLLRTIQTNTTANGSTPYYSTADSFHGWPGGSSLPADMTFYATTRDPGEDPPVGLSGILINHYYIGPPSTMTTTADVTLEITRSDNA